MLDLTDLENKFFIYPLWFLCSSLEYAYTRVEWSCFDLRIGF